MSELRLGSRRAHAINVVKTAGGFQRLGHETVLLCRKPECDGSVDSLLAEYGEREFDVRVADEPGPGATEAQSAAQFAAWGREAFRSMRPDVAYARHFAAGMTAADLGVSTVVETHAHVGDTSGVLRECLGRTKRGDGHLKVVTISQVLRDYYVSLGADPGSVGIVPDGVDLALFQRPRRLPPSPLGDGKGPHAVYCGHLYDYNGNPCILDAAGRAPRVMFHLVGGTPDDIARVRTRIRDASLSNVVLHGQVAHCEVPRYLWHGDVLLMTLSAKHPAAQWASPVKLAEYLASGSAIAASRIDGHSAWVSDSVVTWFTSDSGEDLCRAVLECVAERADARAIRRGAAMALAERYSYTNRAAAILRVAAVTSGLRPGLHADSHSIPSLHMATLD